MTYNSPNHSVWNFRDFIVTLITEEFSTMKVIFNGEIDTSNNSAILSTIIERIHEKAVENDISVVETDIRGLTFLNSTGIKVIVNWIFKMLEMPNDHRYTILFLRSEDIPWQQISIESLSTLAPSYVSLAS